MHLSTLTKYRSLVFNAITAIPLGAFSGLTSLDTLYVSVPVRSLIVFRYLYENSITTIVAGAFSELTNLQILYRSGCG